MTKLWTVGWAAALALAGLIAPVAPSFAASDAQMSVATLELPGKPANVADDRVETIKQPASVDAVTAATNYLFATTTTGSLDDMSTGTATLIGPDSDDVASTVVPIGFDFYFQGVRQDRFSVNSNGSLRLGATVIPSALYSPLGQAGQALVTAYGADQRTHAGDGKVHYKVSGSAPNRVLTVEWLNMQSDFNAGGTANLTYQVRLAETTGTIEFRYGTMTMSAPGAADPNSQKPQIGFSSGNTAGTVGSVTADQSGSPTPSYNGSATAPANNAYVAGPITVLSSAANGSRRIFTFSPPMPAPAIGPLTFSAISTTGMTLNWNDSPDELAYAIYVSSDGGASYAFAGQVSQNATSFGVSGLVASTSYAWRVIALSEGALTASLSGTQSTLTPPPRISFASGPWSAPATWSPVGVPTADDAVMISPGTVVTIDTAAVAYSTDIAGTLQFEQTMARSLTNTSDVSVRAGGILQSNPAGMQTGHALTVGGNLVNDGTLDFSTNTDTAGATLTFTGSANAAFSGTGTTTDIRQIVVNKGTTSDSVLQLRPWNFTVRGVTTDTVAGGWLTLTNGTLHLSGTFVGTSRVFATSAYTISASTGFWLDNPNYTVAGQNGSSTLQGLLRMSQGTLNVGTATGNSMGLATGSRVVVEGGAVNASGRFGIAAAANSIHYAQSGGTVTVCTVGNTSTTLGSFDLGTATGSVISLSGGTIVTQLAATSIDYRNQAGRGISDVSGGTLQIGNAASGAAKTFNLRGVLPDLVVTNTSAGHTATMSTSLVNFNNISRNITISPGSTFNPGNVIFLFSGSTLTNNGTLTQTGTNSNFTFFDTGTTGPQTYTGTGTVTAPLNVLSLQNDVTFASTNQFHANTIRLFTGNVVNANKITLGNGGATTGIVQIGNTTTPTQAGTFDAPFTFNLGTGGQALMYLRTTASRTIGPELNPARSVTTFKYDDDPTHALTLGGGDLTVTGAATLSNSRVVTGSNTLILGAGATVVRTSGYVDGNLRKTFNAAGNASFEVGSANGYTPVTFDATSGTFPGTVTVAAIEGSAPGLLRTGKAVLRHWSLTPAGVTGNAQLSYLDPVDLPITVTEASLRALQRDVANPASYANLGGTINTAANTVSVAGITAAGTLTLGEPIADLSITKTDGVTSVTPGGTTTYTITASNAGPVENPAAVVTDTLPAGLTCSTTCMGSSGGVCTAGPITSHINDTVNLPAGASATYTSVCSIGAALAGTLVNTATVSGGAVVDDDASNNSATDTDTLSATADLSITKTDGVTSATPGGSVTYTITASNAGPSSVTGATVADTFPAACDSPTWTCVGAGGATCTSSGSGHIADTVNLPSGGAVTYTALCPIRATARGSLTNTATVTAPAGVTDPTPGNNSATDTDTLSATADLSITKTDGVTSATPGGSVTYTITASNAGPSSVTGATVADSFPAACDSPTWTCVGAGGATCTSSGSGHIADTVNLPSGGAVTYTALCPIRATASGSLVNTATVAAPAGVTDPTPGNNSATDTDALGAEADLSITKTDGVTSATPGGSVTYTITASNAGPSSVSGATVADSFPAACDSPTWTCVGAGGATCTSSGSGDIADTVNLPSGGAVTYTALCPIRATASGSLVNTATVAAPAGVTDPTPGNNSATDTDTLSATADLSITKTDGVTSATPGGSVTYTITASNAGPSSVAGATVADSFPAACDSPTWTCVGAGGATCTSSGSGHIADTVNLPSGGAVTYTALCPIRATASGSLVNTATVTAPAGVTDPTPGNNSATDTDALGAEADLSITKTDGVTSATPGDVLSYTIVASNAGPSSVTGATVTDTFPAACVSPTWTCAGANGGVCASAGSGDIADTVDLPAGGGVTYTALCPTDPALADGVDIRNTATIDAPPSVTDPDPSNNQATDATTTVRLGAAVSATKSVSGGVSPGSTVNYTIVMSNSGPGVQGDNPGDELVDVLPPQLALVSASASSGIVAALTGSNTVTWNGTLAAGASATITITATIVPTTPSGPIANQAEVHYDADGDGLNEATGLSRDPAMPGGAGPTLIHVVAPMPPAGPKPVPATGWLALVALMLGMGWTARRRMERR